MRNILVKAISLALVALPFGVALPALAAVPQWNTTGSYVVAMNYLGSDYAHDIALTQDSAGNLTGSGGSPAGAQVYTWVITSGTVSGATVDFTANYTATADAVTPQTVMHVVGTIATSGTMSGTWSDNYQGGVRNGTWTSTTGVAVPLGALAAEDFGVANYDTGLGILKGYTAGFGLTDATFGEATSVVVKLYSAGNVLLQTNTLDSTNTPLITGVQISSPFDVSGSFDYATDGYWTNVRESEYGQSVPATKVVATVTLMNGKIITAENTALVGDPTTIYPPVAPTTATVHIFKYIDGLQATVANANGVIFPMFTATYNAPFTLGPGGWTAGDIDYEASTSPIPIGSPYSAEENLSTSLVGSSCDGSHTYALVGYGAGDTLSQAAQATSSLTIPSFTNLQGDKYIIVKNHLCSATTTPTTGHLVVEKTTNPSASLVAFSVTATGTGIITGSATGTITDAIDKHFEVASGTYSVTEAPTAGWTTTSNTCLNVAVAASTTVHCVITNTQLLATSSNSISGMKYNDLNRNGKKDVNEPGLAGWVIILKKGQHLIATTSTDINGNYSFSNIATGTYKVREIHQKGWNRMSKNPKAIVITAGSVVTDVNFGNAKKHRHDREDDYRDDNRDDERGKYHAHSGRSSYENDRNERSHHNR